MVEDNNSDGGRKFDGSDGGDRALAAPPPFSRRRVNPYSIMFVIAAAATIALWTSFLLWLAAKMIAWTIAII